MQHTSNIVTIAHEGAVVNAIENRYSNGCVTQRVYANGFDNAPTDIRLIRVATGKKGFALDTQIYNQEYLTNLQQQFQS